VSCPVVVLWPGWVKSEQMRLVQVAQHADDLSRASAFYTDLLGTPPTASFDPPGLVFFDLDGVRLLLEGGVTSAVVYLGVDDVVQTIERVRRQGVTVVGEPHVIFSHADDTLGPAGHDEWMAFIEDSEGNTIGLVSHTPR
jgi:predicted enzyme related to lactoylglutathione lyase